MIAPIKKETVIQDIIEAVEGGQFVLSDHALVRMQESNIYFSDLMMGLHGSMQSEV
jgi:hypothetical protein